MLVRLLTTQQAFPRSAILMAISPASWGSRRSRGRPGSLAPAAGDTDAFAGCLLHVKGAKKKKKNLTARRGGWRWSGGRNPPGAEMAPGADGVQTVSQQEGVPLQQQLRTFDLRQTGGAPGDGGRGEVRQGRSVPLLVRHARMSAPAPVLPRQAL